MPSAGGRPSTASSAASWRTVARIGSIVDFYFTDSPIRSSRGVWSSNLRRRRALDYDLLAGGIYNAPVHRYHLSLAHTPDDVARTLTLIDGSLAG